MLWWLIGLWICSPVLLPIFWLLGRLGQSLASSSEDPSPAARSSDLTPGE